jgi:rRNA-processing protein FCF1
MLLVDAANVVGSRPDGWWRDRSGAARRLVEEIRAATAAGRLTEPVVVVLEGAARAGVDEGDIDGVEVIHAPGSGDDTVVDSLPGDGESVVVVTSDRGLRGRVEGRGAGVVGPRWLLDRLES